MSWQFETVDEALDPIQQASAPTDLSDSFTFGFLSDAAKNPSGHRLISDEYFKDYLKSIDAATGKSNDWGTLSPRTVDRLITEEDKENLSQTLDTTAAEFDAKIKQIREENPNANFQVKTFNQLRQETEQNYVAYKKMLDEDVAAANREGTLGGYVAEYAGRFLGFMADPRNIALTLLSGGTAGVGAKALAKFGAQSAGAQAAIELSDATRLTGLSDEEKLLQSAANIATAGIAAPALVKTVDVASPILGAVFQKVGKLWGLATNKAGEVLEPKVDKLVKAAQDRGYTKAAEDIRAASKGLKGEEAVAANDIATDFETIGAAQKLSGQSEDIIRRDFNVTQDYLLKGDVPPISDDAIARAIKNNPDDFTTSKYNNLEELEIAMSRAKQEAVYDAKGNRDYATETKNLRTAIDQAREENARIGARMAEDASNVSERDFVSRTERQAFLDEPGALESPLVKTAKLSGDDMKGFSAADDIFGDPTDVTMGAARKAEKINNDKKLLDELKNCMVGL